MSGNKFVEAFQYLVAYQVVLEDSIERSKEELDWFDSSFKTIMEDHIRDKEKELENLNTLIKNW